MDPKPLFMKHRYITSPAAESAVLATLIGALKLRGKSGTDPIRGAIATAGFKTIEVLVKLDGGTAATVTLEPLEVIQWIDDDGNLQDEFVRVPGVGAVLADGEKYSVQTNGGLIFMRVAAVTGSPTALRILVSGGEQL